MRQIRAAIVDDEPLAREGLRLRIEAAGDFDVVAEYGDGHAATAMVSLHPDVVFLDVRMPHADGFHLLHAVGHVDRPAVVFVTAFAEHALAAFRVGALDYLMKPFDDETLHDSLDRVRQHVARVDASNAATATDGHLLTHNAARDRDLARSLPATRLAVRVHGHLHYVDTAAIRWVESVGDHVRIHVDGARHLLRRTLQSLEQQLDHGRFVRVHRTAIVATQRIRELRPYSRGEYLVVLDDGTSLPLSRRCRTRVTGAIEGLR